MDVACKDEDEDMTQAIFASTTTPTLEVLARKTSTAADPAPTPVPEARLFEAVTAASAVDLAPEEDSPPHLFPPLTASLPR